MRSVKFPITLFGEPGGCVFFGKRKRVYGGRRVTSIPKAPSLTQSHVPGRAMLPLPKRHVSLLPTSSDSPIRTVYLSGSIIDCPHFSGRRFPSFGNITCAVPNQQCLLQEEVARLLRTR